MRVCRPGWRVRLVQLANLPPINQADACGLPVLTFTPPVRVHPFELPTARLNGHLPAGQPHHKNTRQAQA